MRTQESIHSLVACLILHTFSPAPCVAAPDVTADQYVAEFLTEGKSGIAPDGWSPKEQVLSDKEFLTRLRKQSPSLLAVAIANSGFHPRWTMVFLAIEDNVRVIATLTYWGHIQMKRVGQIPRAKYDEMVRELLPELTCTPEMKSDFMTRGFIYWNFSKATFCDANPFGDDGAKLGQALDPLLQASEVRFNVWKDKK